MLQNLSNKKKTQSLKVPFKHKVHHVFVELRYKHCNDYCSDYLNQVSLFVRKKWFFTKKRVKSANRYSSRCIFAVKWSERNSQNSRSLFETDNQEDSIAPLSNFRRCYEEHFIDLPFGSNISMLIQEKVNKIKEH